MEHSVLVCSAGKFPELMKGRPVLPVEAFQIKKSCSIKQLQSCTPFTAMPYPSIKMAGPLMCQLPKRFGSRSQMFFPNGNLQPKNSGTFWELVYNKWTRFGPLGHFCKMKEAVGEGRQGTPIFLGVANAIVHALLICCCALFRVVLFVF